MDRAGAFMNVSLFHYLVEKAFDSRKEINLIKDQSTIQTKWIDTWTRIYYEAVKVNPFILIKAITESTAVITKQQSTIPHSAHFFVVRLFVFSPAFHRKYPISLYSELIASDIAFCKETSGNHLGNRFAYRVFCTVQGRIQRPNHPIRLRKSYQYGIFELIVITRAHGFSLKFNRVKSKKNRQPNLRCSLEI